MTSEPEHKMFRPHGNGEEVEYQGDVSFGEKHCEGYEYAEDCARRPKHRNRSPRSPACQGVTQAGAGSRQEIELQKAPISETSFKLRAEHPQDEHVQEEVQEVSVQEHVGEQLPEEEVAEEQTRHQIEVGKRSGSLEDDLKDEDHDVEDDQEPYGGGKLRTEPKDRTFKGVIVLLPAHGTALPLLLLF